jgi:hypothetical protein
MNGKNVIFSYLQGDALKILTYLLVLLILLSGGFYGVTRFKPEWNPLKGLQFGGPQVVAMKTADPATYQNLRDSIDALDLAIRTETDPRLLKGLKDRQEYFWQRLASTRTALTPAPVTDTLKSQQSEEQEFGGLVQTLTKVLAITAGGLLVVIIALMLMLRRRKVEMTRKLEALKSDERFKSPRGGFQEAADPTLVRARRRDNQDATFAGTNLPNVQPRTPSPTLAQAAAQTLARTAAQTTLRTGAQPVIQTGAQPAIPPEYDSHFEPDYDHTVAATQASNLRPTARQRVTNAIKGLAEALAALKAPSAAPERATRARMRVTSQNSTRYTQSMDATHPGLPDPHPLEATRFDREREEKGDIVKLARRGYTSSEIARRLRIPQDQVETVIRLQRESGE